MRDSVIKERILNTLFIEFKDLIIEYTSVNHTDVNISDDSPIWVLWYQGFEQAPPIIKACINSIKKNSGTHPVIVLSKDNISDYLKLPDNIVTKFKKGFFSITHLSDIIRLGLLTKYGGYWIDSTYFLTSPIISRNMPFFSLKQKNCNYKSVVHCMWSGNFLGVGKNNSVTKFLYNAFVNYWEENNTLIDYFLLDYVIRLAFDYFPEFHKYVLSKFSKVKNSSTCHLNIKGDKILTALVIN